MILREEKCQNSQFAQTRAMTLESKNHGCAVRIANAAAHSSSAA